LIRINLLPIQEFRRVSRLKKQIVIYAVSVAACVVLMAVVYLQAAGGLAQLRADEEALTTREAALRTKVKKVDALNKEEEGLQLKLNVIADLEAQRKGPVRILDEVSRQIPVNRAWLVHLNKSGSNLTLKGVAMDNETVADFIENLKTLKRIESLLKALEELDDLLARAEQLKKLDELKARIDGLKDLRPAPKDLVARLEEIESPEDLVSRKDDLIKQVKLLRKGRIRTNFYFDNVDLVRSTEEVRNEMRLKSFSITCSLVLTEKKPDEEADKAAKKS